MSYKILIDPGHGGNDRANKGPTKYIEADGVLKISLYLRDELLKTNQFEVKLTRETDASLGIRQRGEIAAAWGADLAISEHTNASGNGTARGTEVFYSVGLPADKDFAELVSYRISKAFEIPNRGAKTRVNPNKAGRDYYAFIDGAKMGGVPHILLVESAFHDNKQDEALLLQDNNLKLIAWIQAGAICSHFKVRNTLKLFSGNDWAVREVQKTIGTDIDGLFGPNTEKAVKDFQSKYGLVSDGIVGPKTWEKIDSLQPKPVETLYTPIMGKQEATADQLFEYANAINPNPKISVSLMKLCEMFLEEGEIEEVRGDIAFCQSCKETGFFTYGGLAKPEWYNYSGLGVTGQIDAITKVPFGNKFPDARTGIRAQIQHLKAYASTEPLKQLCVDLRFSGVKRGRAPYWEWLGRDENPENASRAIADRQGWAVPGPTYGHDIVKMFNKVMEIPKKEVDKEEDGIFISATILEKIYNWLKKLLGK